MKHHYYFFMDAVGACNLRCRSCAVGNTPEVRNPRGSLAPETLRRIMEKATGECYVDGIGLYNWAEPLLNPRLPELIRVVHEFGVQCDLSTNLNKAQRLPELIRENPMSIRISVSGFTQGIYGMNHRGGNIEKVKEHMKQLAEIKACTGATTTVWVVFHRHLFNLDDEEPMRLFSEKLGFRFLPVWALWLPLEKILAAVGETEYGNINVEDQRAIDNLGLPLKEALEATRRAKSSHCHQQENVISLDIQGRVQLCCGVYDASRFSVANYLDTPVDRIQARRFRHATCKLCMHYGVHDYFLYRIPQIDSIAYANVASKTNAIERGVLPILGREIRNKS